MSLFCCYSKPLTSVGHPIVRRCGPVSNHFRFVARHWIHPSGPAPRPWPPPPWRRWPLPHVMARWKRPSLPRSEPGPLRADSHQRCWSVSDLWSRRDAAQPQDGKGRKQRLMRFLLEAGSVQRPPQSFTLLILSEGERFPNFKVIAEGEHWLLNHHKSHIFSWKTCKKTTDQSHLFLTPSWTKKKRGGLRC